MCYDPSARPPDPPESRGEAAGQDLMLTAQDGNKFAAFESTPQNPRSAQVVILPDVRGLHDFYKHLAMRFAEVGIRALAVDYFGRTAGIGPRDDAFDYMKHVEQTTAPGVFADAGAALAHLQQDGGATTPTFALGFCRGGSLTLLVGTQDFKLNGLVAFYPGLSRTITGTTAPVLQEAAKIHYPLLALFGGADQGIPVEQVQRLEDELSQAGVDHEIAIYPGAPHSFFDRKAVEYASASADAWSRVLNFVDTHKG